MNIALCTDENFSVPALVCITSIFENNKDTDCDVYVLTDGISKNAYSKFLKLSELYAQKIEIMIIDRHRFDGLTVNERFPVSMYYRFLLPEMLPTEDKVLYLDCDIIVRHSLIAMYKTPLTNMALAAVVGESTDDIRFENILRLTSKYYNSGVLLMNLKYWRENKVTDTLIQWINDNPDKCALPDQNALNKVLDGKTIYLDYTYNYQEWWFGDMTSWMHYSKWDEIRAIGMDPAIVHYCEAEKPWFVECKNPYQYDFLKYANMHKFIGFKLRKRYGLTWKFSVFIDKIGLKFRYWAEQWQKHIISKIRVS